MLERRWIKWGLLLMGWTLLGLFAATRLKLSYFYSGQPITWRNALILALTDWYVWAALSPLIIWLARRFPLEPQSWSSGLLAQIPASVFLSIFKMALEFFVRRQLAPDFARRFPSLEFYSTLFTFWAIVGAVYAFDYYRKYRQHELRASQLETQLAQAQLQALRMQLNPHFLFNTLHAISSLMHKDVRAADRMIARLSDLLRLTLENAGQQEVSLRQELEFLESYLEIEQTRFRDRLQIRMEIAPETLDACVPNLILQPLVENAIRHGIAPRAASGAVEIRARRVAETLELQVRDNGRGLPNGALNGLKEGVGLTNTRARLEQLYGAAQRFELNNRAEGGLNVSLTIPFRPATNHLEEDEKRRHDKAQGTDH